MPGLLRTLLLGATLALSWSCLDPASARAAEDGARVTARALGYSGVEAFQRGSYALASEKLEQAYGMLRAPTLGLWSARALERLGRLVAAAKRYQEVGSLDPTEGDEAVQRKAQTDAASELKVLLRRIPSVVFIVEGLPAESPVVLRLDGATLPEATPGKLVPLDPGSHRLVAHSDDRAVEQTFVVHDYERKNVVIQLTAADSPSASLLSDTGKSPSLQQKLGWAGVGVGGAAILTGAVLGGIALNDESGRGCNGKPCAPGQAPTRGHHDSLRTLSMASLVFGAASAGAGAVLLLTLPKESATATRVSALLGFNRVGVTGSF